MPLYLINKEDFQSILSNPKVPRLDKILLILFCDNELPKSHSEIKQIANDNGLREIYKWNVSDTLGKAKRYAILIKGNWQLTSAGKIHLISEKYLSVKKSHLKNDIADLQAHIQGIVDPQIKSFIEEAITCLEADQRRAAVVLSWIGAIAILYDAIVNTRLTDFNTEATKRDAKWKAAKNTDDLTRMKEFEFLNVLEAISFIGKNVKSELQNCLQLRNSCGHPNSLKIGERKVAAHLEILILNVFSKY